MLQHNNVKTLITKIKVKVGASSHNQKIMFFLLV